VRFCMSSTYERPGVNELLTFPGDDTVQVNGTLDVKSGNVSVLRTSPTGLTTRIIVCDNLETSTSNVNALGVSVGNLTTTTANLETEYDTLNSVQQGHEQQLTALQNKTVNQSASATEEDTSTSFVGVLYGDNVLTASHDLNRDMTIVKTRLQNITATIQSTTFGGDVTAARFITPDGQPNQYLMADGSVLEASGANSNATMHFFKNKPLSVDEPSPGEIAFNAQNESATVIWISHVTSDGTDVHAFLKLMTPLSVLYIQDNNDSENYVKYSVVSTTSTPTLFIVTVNFIEGNGNGLTTFGNNHDIFLSIFSNNVAIDGRFTSLEGRATTLEEKTFAISKLNVDDVNETGINSTLNMQDHRITQVSDPEDGQDVVTKSYMEAQNYAGEESIIDKLTDFLTASTPEIDLGGAVSAAGALASEGGVAAIIALIALKLDTILAYQLFYARDGTTPMTGDVDMGGFSINNALSLSASGDVTAVRFVKAGGGSPTEFLKSDGTYDSSSYITADDGQFDVLLARTQNVTSTDGNTTLMGQLTVTSEPEVVDWRTGNMYTNTGSLNGDATAGAVFTVNANLFVTTVYVPAILYVDSGPLTFSFWQDTGSLIASYVIPKTTLVDGNYTLTLPVSLQLVSGTYRYGVSGAFLRTNGSPLFFNPLITGVRGRYAFGLNQFPSLFFFPDTDNIQKPLSGGFFVQTYTQSTVYADRFVRTDGGSAGEFLKSNGTYDTNVYATQSTLTSGLAAKLDTSTAASTYATLSALASGLAAKLDTSTAASTYATQSALTSGLSAKIDTSVANSTFATQTALTSGLALKLDTTTAATTYVTQAAVFVNTVIGPVITGPQATPVSMFSTTGGFGSRTVNNFSQGKTVEVSLRGTFSFADGKQQETVTPSVFLNGVSYWTPTIIQIPGGSVTSGHFVFLFEFTFCAASNYQLFFRYFFSDSNGEEKLHGSAIATVSSFSTLGNLDVRVAMLSDPSALTMTASQQRIRMY